MSQSTPKPVLSDETRAAGVAFLMKTAGMNEEQAKAQVGTVETELEDEEGFFVALGATEKDIAEFVKNANEDLQAEAKTA